MKQKIHFILTLLFLFYNLKGQNSLSLSAVIKIATNSSLAAFKEKNLYMASFWEYRSYIAQKKPSLTLNSTLLDYNRSFTKRYNSILDIDEYREQQNIFSNANASISQNLPFCGGTLYVDSEVGRLQDFGDNSYTQFSAVPLRIGLIQPLLGYNKFKWLRKIEPLKYEKAKKSYLQSTERISLQITEYFFNLLAAQARLTMAIANVANADTLYQIGQQRLEIASLSQADVLILKVDALNAKNDLATANKLLNNARFSFFSYLRMPEDASIMLTMPESLPSFQVNFDDALSEAQINNPLLLEYQQQVLESEGNVEQVRREGLINAYLTISYGLNQQSTTFPTAYRDPLDQQRASIGLSIPIVDWGQRRGAYNMAKNNYEAVKLTAEQSETDFKQTVMLAVSDFNMQQDLVKTACETYEVARKAYNITKQRFVIGKTDVNSLGLALERQDQANLNYIEALRLYWKYYYTVRLLTLFNFEKNKTLLKDFDELMDH